MHDVFENLARRASIAGNRAAIASAEGVLSYAQLLARIRGAAQWSRRLPRRLALMCGKTSDGIVADLALSFAGKELVPLPAFFSDAQLAHIVATAQLSHSVVDRASGERAKRLGLIACELGADAAPGTAPAADASRIIFTSGSTGHPKGVQLTGRHLLASVAALAEVTGASANDRYLSLLPHSLLLEQIVGVYLPLAVGAAIHLPEPSSDGGPISITRAAETARATTTVLVPELLSAWLHELVTSQRRPPESLRFVAVGGAPVSERLAAAAWAHGLPVHEGYGLSECSSVVAVNSPSARRPRTVGRPLPGIRVTVQAGEIVVSGPTVMHGYLGEEPVTGPWRTGDLGHVDDDGYLVVTGRKDALIVTSAGRNVSPEWIEDLMTAEGRITRCVAVEHQGELAALVVPQLCSAAPGDPISLRDLVRDAARDVPDYAKPRRFLVVSDEELRRFELVTANLRPRRSAIRRFIAERSDRLSSAT